MLVQAVEHRVVVDVDTDLRHPPLPDRSPETADTIDVCQQTGRSGCRSCRRLCLIDANWASIADHNLASRSGSSVRWVWCIPDGLSTQRRTDTAAFCLSSSDSPSSPANRLASSRQRRSNTPTGSIRANPNNASCSPPRRSRPASSKPFDAFATASTWLADTSRRRARSRSRASAHTPRNDPTPLSSPASSVCPYPVNTSAADSERPSAANSRDAAGDRHIDRIHPTPHPLRQRHRRAQTSPVTPATARPPTARRSPRRHHDPPSPNPSRPHDQPGGSRMPTTLNRGCHNDPEQG